MVELDMKMEDSEPWISTCHFGMGTRSQHPDVLDWPTASGYTGIGLIAFKEINTTYYENDGDTLHVEGGASLIAYFARNETDYSNHTLEPTRGWVHMAMALTENEVIWYVDGKEINRYVDTTTEGRFAFYALGRCAARNIKVKVNAK